MTVIEARENRTVERSEAAAIDARLAGRYDGRLTARVAGQVAWVFGAVAVVQVALGLYLGTLNRLDLRQVFGDYLITQVVGTLSFAAVGTVILTRRPGNAIGWLLCILSITYGIEAWTFQYARYTSITDPGSLPAGDVVTWLSWWLWVPGAISCAVILPLIFPDGRLLSARWRPLVGLAIAAATLIGLGIALDPEPETNLPEIANPVAPAVSAVLRMAIELGGNLLAVVCLIGAIAGTIARYHRAHSIERQQIKWFASAVVLLVAAMVTPAIIDPTGFTSDTLLSSILLTLALPCVPLAIGVAILRYRLWDIDLIINRAIVYGALTTCVIGIYVVIVGAFSAFVHERGSLVVSLVAAGSAAVAFEPLRRRLQRGVNRLMYGERDNPYAVLSRLGQRLEGSLAAELVLPTIVETVREALKLPYVAINLHNGDELVMAAASGTPGETALRLPLVYQQETLGELALAPRTPGEPFNAADHRLVHDLARQIGIAAHNVQLTTESLRLNVELQRSRERLVIAREEERRRLRRDLHDGLAPTLAALNLKAGTIRTLVSTDPIAAQAVIDEWRAELRATIGDVRRLAYALRPPILDELGLIAAIRELADQFSARQLPVTVDATEPDHPLPAAVEVAAYRIVQEALTNVERHAQAGSCHVRLWGTPETFFIEVTDNGSRLRGSETHHRAGVGILAMRERTAELGGTCIVEATSTGGTRVFACFPITRDTLWNQSES